MNSRRLRLHPRPPPPAHPANRWKPQRQTGSSATAEPQRVAESDRRRSGRASARPAAEISPASVDLVLHISEEENQRRPGAASASGRGAAAGGHSTGCNPVPELPSCGTSRSTGAVRGQFRPQPEHPGRAQWLTEADLARPCKRSDGSRRAAADRGPQSTRAFWWPEMASMSWATSRISPALMQTVDIGVRATAGGRRREGQGAQRAGRWSADGQPPRSGRRPMVATLIARRHHRRHWPCPAPLVADNGRRVSRACAWHAP